MSGRRNAQLSSQIQREVGVIVASGLSDPRIGFCSVTAVELSSDNRYAHVYVSLLGDEEERGVSFAALKRATGFVRHELASRLAIRYVPELDFRIDTSIERGARVLSIMRELEAEHE